MRRREFITLLGGAAVGLPLAARAQQPGMPLVGYVRSGSRGTFSRNEAAFRQGLGSAGFVEGRNVVIDYRYDENENDRLPALITDLVRRPVTVIYAANTPPAVAAKAITQTIPIIFRTGGDPVQLGLVTSINRPDGNLTGVSFLSSATGSIRLQMLHEAIPDAASFGLLLNPRNPAAELEKREAQEAARKLGIELQVVSASNALEIETAFATLLQRRAQALVIAGDQLFTSRRQQLAALTARHAIPAISSASDIAHAGTLMSYGASQIEAERLGGIYVGRVLKGDKPADLPVQQSVKVELIINLIVAKVLGVTFPLTLLGRADEVIE